MRLDAAKYEARAKVRSGIDHVCLGFEEVRSRGNLDKYVTSFLKVTGEFEITSIQTDFRNVREGYRADVFANDFGASGKRYPRVLVVHLTRSRYGARLHHEGIQVPPWRKRRGYQPLQPLSRLLSYTGLSTERSVPLAEPLEEA